MQEELAKSQNEENIENTENTEQQTQNSESVNENNADEPIAKLDDKGENLADKLAEAEDKFLRLFAEFENYKRRTNKERVELFKTANQEVLQALLPVLDDFDRSVKAADTATAIEAVKEGIVLVQHKLTNILSSKGLKAIEVKQGDDFNVDFHEAITSIPAPTEETKGKIVDVVEKGYLLNDKVIRFAKVVIGE
ncbi:MAG: nucleotide exchange factor GrpE [Bacteroidia bacterium]